MCSPLKVFGTHQSHTFLHESAVLNIFAMLATEAIAVTQRESSISTRCDVSHF